ncbi:uncharacterized protein Aud_006811 [Aspergillus udagawae]|uniref:Uncharacterized protein n=1 Tax=Aspergillus udagawae TaxID=91492 RepID=A0A8E0QS06_9EURO|nr:uncharacterized protein Aud_006811 [Aspergillus udagawae]GIC90377.1 hypothetical protein Aud_006811 [Aspergillus udagawae]
MPPTELLNLTHIVSEAAQSIDQFINEHGDCLSFNPQAPDLPPLSPETAAFHRARITLCGAASNLIDLTLTARESVVFRCFNVHTASALRIAYRFKLAHAVPLDGSVIYDVIAQRVRLPATAVERVIAVLISSHFFHLAPNGISHTQLSHLLASNERFEAFLGLCFEEVFIGSTHLANALQIWGASIEPNETGWNIANVTQNMFYQHLESDTSSSE